MAAVGCLLQTYDRGVDADDANAITVQRGEGALRARVECIWCVPGNYWSSVPTFLVYLEVFGESGTGESQGGSLMDNAIAWVVR